jgi:hypothetical protein
MGPASCSVVIYGLLAKEFLTSLLFSPGIKTAFLILDVVTSDGAGGRLGVEKGSITKKSPGQKDPGLHSVLRSFS